MASSSVRRPGSRRAAKPATLKKTKRTISAPRSAALRASKRRTTVKKAAKAAAPKKVLKKKIVSFKMRRKPRTTKISGVRLPKALPRTTQLERHPDNPILAPLAEHAWEANQTFNAAALNDGGAVHLLYRSIGHDGLSRFGYASSTDGVTIDERSAEPAFTLEIDPKDKPAIPGWYSSGGSWGGAEDPRLAAIDGKIYMTYTGIYDGLPRVALASIERNDFLDHVWKWSRSKFISPPGEVHKNWVLFPEKINGKFAIMHSMSPKIEVEYLDDLDFEDGSHIKSTAYHRADVQIKDGTWEKSIRGPGPTPIKTKYGWLVLYHGTTKDCGYKMGAMLLDRKDPTKIIARADEAILEPSTWYEQGGWKGNIIYSCGAVVVGDDLLIYYGAADSVLCVAKANLEDFLKALIDTKKPKVKNRM